MYYLIAAAAIIFIALVMKWWMGVNAEEGFLGKGLMLIVVVLVIIGILVVFGVMPSFR
jgi:hypothetical protein